MQATVDEMLLVSRAVAGDGVALERLLLLHRPLLQTYIERHAPHDLRRQVETQDIVQDVWVEAFRRIDAFQPTDGPSFSRWLLRLARNRIIDLVRRHRARKRGGLIQGGIAQGEFRHESMVLLLQDLAVYERTPSRSALTHELIAALEQAMLQLPATYAQAIRLRYLQSLEIGEIAEQMGRSEHAVHMLCSRAIKSLRGLMGAQSLSL